MNIYILEISPPPVHLRRLWTVPDKCPSLFRCWWYSLGRKLGSTKWKTGGKNKIGHFIKHEHPISEEWIPKTLKIRRNKANFFQNWPPHKNALQCAHVPNIVRVGVEFFLQGFTYIYTLCMSILVVFQYTPWYTSYSEFWRSRKTQEYNLHE